MMAALAAALLAFWYGAYRLRRKIGMLKSLVLLTSLLTVAAGLTAWLCRIFPNLDGPPKDIDESWRIPS